MWQLRSRLHRLLKAVNVAMMAVAVVVELFQTGLICDSNQLCSGCVSDSDCPSVCSEGICVDCRTDSDCPLGTLCDGNGECVIQGYLNEIHYDSPHGVIKLWNLVILQRDMQDVAWGVNVDSYSHFVIWCY